VAPKGEKGKARTKTTRKAPHRRVYRTTAWRQRRINAIADRCERFGLGTRLADYIAARYGVVRLVELSDAELQHEYRRIAHWSLAIQMPLERSMTGFLISQTK
jgi:hypothetical protein